MKRVLLLAVMASYAYGNSDWQDQPFGKRSSGQVEQSDNQKSNKKQMMPWYKKPATKYIAGGVFSALVTAYAAMNYMHVDCTEKNLPVDQAVDTSAESSEVDNRDVVALQDSLTLPQDFQSNINVQVGEQEQKKSAAKWLAMGAVATVITAVGYIGGSMFIEYIGKALP